MIPGVVTADGVPIIRINVAGGEWPAIVDTGFNGDLELPEALRQATNPRFLCRIHSHLAGGHRIEEDCFLVEFPFDGRNCMVEATFVDSEYILLGTRMLREYRLSIDFVQRGLVIERPAPGPLHD